MIGFLMMDTMRGDPGDGTAFECQTAADRKKVFQQPGRLVGPVSVEPMIAQADAKAGRHPVQKHRNPEISPTENEQRRNRPQMEQGHGNARGPVQSLVLSNLKDLTTHLSPIMLVIPT